MAGIKGRAAFTYLVHPKTTSSVPRSFEPQHPGSCHSLSYIRVGHSIRPSHDSYMQHVTLNSLQHVVGL